MGSTYNAPYPCTNDLVYVMIVDYCPSSTCRGILNLSKEAFSLIANPKAGGIKVDYDEYYI
ncbi:RlpA-like double-psi beta-barrel domain containing protein [Trema orientale]|uniref:RlpA-like double-psi beta-barrel domain containing protein n=1 Tax=Trema orientale TaxID=63057 RepID=A0A2P5EQ64_TREOI|nr:RlpA-like double-psi beta-barrel domain containing protein [Trema orientale]